MRRLLNCLLLAAIAATGCARRESCYPIGFARGPVDIARTADNPPLTIDETRIPPFSEADALLKRSPHSGPLRSLGELDCQCLAVRGASLANLVQLEIDALRCAETGRDGPQQRLLDMRRRVLMLRAQNERNLAAGEALEAYYQLGETEQQAPLLSTSLLELDRAIGFVQQMEQQGLRVQVDASSLRSQRIDLVRRQTQLATARAQLNGQLRVLLNLDTHDLTPIWPIADWTPRFEPVDVDLAIAQSLQYRADLAVLRLVLNSLDDPNAAPLAEQVLRQADFVLASSTQQRSLVAMLREKHDNCKLFYRREQIAELERDLRRVIVEEVRQRAFALEGELRAVALAHDKLQMLQQHHGQLEERRQADEVTAFDITTAALEIQKARSELLSRIAAWKIAESRLRQAIGLLPLECGYSAPIGDCEDGAGCLIEPSGGEFQIHSEVSTSPFRLRQGYRS